MLAVEPCLERAPSCGAVRSRGRTVTLEVMSGRASVLVWLLIAVMLVGAVTGRYWFGFIIL